MPAPFYADCFSLPSANEKRVQTKSERRDKGTARWTTAEVREIVDAAKEPAEAGGDRRARPPADLARRGMSFPGRRRRRQAVRRAR